MRDYIDIGPNPADETLCYDVQSSAKEQQSECRAFITAIRRKLGEEVGSARLAIKGNPHDFGTYYEVVCYYDDNDEEGMNYAFKCESDAPSTWAEVGMTVFRDDELGRVVTHIHYSSNVEEN